DDEAEEGDRGIAEPGRRRARRARQLDANRAGSRSARGQAGNGYGGQEDIVLCQHCVPRETDGDVERSAVLEALVLDRVMDRHFIAKVDDLTVETEGSADEIGQRAGGAGGELVRASEQAGAAEGFVWIILAVVKRRDTDKVRPVGRCREIQSRVDAIL